MERQLSSANDCNCLITRGEDHGNKLTFPTKRFFPRPGDAALPGATPVPNPAVDPFLGKGGGPFGLAKSTPPITPSAESDG